MLAAINFLSSLTLGQSLRQLGLYLGSHIALFSSFILQVPKLIKVILSLILIQITVFPLLFLLLLLIITLMFLCLKDLLWCLA